MPIPNSLTPRQYLTAVLKRGLVVKISGDVPFSSPHPHHFVILNYDPSTKSILIVAHATHQVQKECEKALEQGEDVNKTVVYIGDKAYRFFPRPTVFNCNEVDELTFDQMVTAMEKNVLEVPANDTLTESDLQKIIDGALASTQTTPYISELLQAPQS